MQLKTIFLVSDVENGKIETKKQCFYSRWFLQQVVMHAIKVKYSMMKFIIQSSLEKVIQGRRYKALFNVI